MKSLLHENWNRFYDPVVGQYTSVEPLLTGPPWNETAATDGVSIPAYSYALNNPVTYVDEDGLGGYWVDCQDLEPGLSHDWSDSADAPNTCSNSTPASDLPKAKKELIDDTRCRPGSAFSNSAECKCRQRLVDQIRSERDAPRRPWPTPPWNKAHPNLRGPMRSYNRFLFSPKGA